MWEFNYGVFWAILAALFVRGLYKYVRAIVTIMLKARSDNERPTTLDDIAELLLRM